MDLAEDIRQFVLATLPYKPEERSGLVAMNVNALLTTYFNWRSRFVPARPRKVHLSTALSANPLASDPLYKPALDQIITSIETGADLTPYLSKRIKHGYQNTGQADRQDLDLLLNDWGIHHLHLSTELETGGFVKRTGPLMFAIFRPDDAYVIDVVNHRAWTRHDVMRVIVREWPNAGFVYHLPGWRLPSPLSDEDHQALRQGHVMAGIEIDGMLYFPTSMLTTAGVAVQSVQHADDVCQWIRWFEKQVKDDSAFIARSLAEAGFEPPPNPDLHWEFVGYDGYSVVERHTGAQLQLA